MFAGLNCLNLDSEKKTRNLVTFLFGILMLAVFSISVSAQNNNLVANPGQSRAIEVGTSITLDGSDSTSSSGLRLTYAWSLIQQPAGSLAVLGEANDPRPNLVPDLAGDYIAELIVTDSDGNSSSAQTVLLTTNNIPPVAIAGPNRFTTVGQSLRFDPEGTYDANGDRLDASWSISSFPSESTDPDPTDPVSPGENNQFCPVTATESLGTFHVVTATSNQQNPQLAVGQPLAEGATETGNSSATTYWGPITMDLTGDASIFVPAGEVIEVVLSSAWGNQARAEILMSADGENYTSLGTVGNGGSVYGAYSSNILRYDDFVVPAGGARFLQVMHQNGGVRADGAIYNTQCQSGDAGSEPSDEEDQSDLASLTEDEGGRYIFTPNVPGDYTIQLLVEDEAGAQSIDSVNVYVGPADGTGDPADANIAPVANAGASQIITAGQEIILDGSQSSDVNGDMLTYQWSILSKPADSFSQLENVSTARASLTPDTDRTYILQLEVTDMDGLKDYDTVVLSGDFIEPLAVSGGPDAGADGQISDNSASVDGSASQAGQGTGFNLAYEWSVLGLSEGESAIANPQNASTTIDFPQDVGGGLIGVDNVEAIELLNDYNVIVFGDTDSNVDLRGRTLIGGNLFGSSATYGTRLPQGQNIDALSVVGDITGAPKNINNGGNVLHGGTVSAIVNLNGGGQLINDPALSVTSEQSGLLGLSSTLSGLTANSTAEIPNPNGQPAPARLNATPDENGVAVFDISDGNLFFSNDRVQQIEVNANGAETIIVNIGGADIDFDRGNFVGAINNDDLRRKIIWNFHEATDLYFDRAFNGTVLAPNAYLHNRTEIRGSVIVDTLMARGPIDWPGFTGSGLISGGEGVATDFALVQLAVSDTENTGLAPSYSSTVLTTGNLRPVARITQTGGPGFLTPGTEVGFNAASSFDGNQDALTYNWSILSKPEGSSIELDNTTSLNVSATPDKGGVYVIQLIVSDGELASRPVTLAFEARNTAPTANAGSNQSVFKGDLVSLDGSASSDPDGDDITYAWAITDKPEGSLAELTDSETATPSFVADVKGEYTVSLVVNDGFQDSESDTVLIAVENRKPIAVISGTNEGFAGDMISVSAIGSSDPDGDVLTYLWSLQGPTGSTANLSDNSVVSPMFTADEAGVYTLTLIVSDGTLSSEPVSFSVQIEGGNRAPVLDDIGDQTVALGKTLNFGVSATDVDGDNLSFFVNPTPLPVGTTFDTNTGVFTFAPSSLTPETYTISFGVTDGSLTDSETISVAVTNEGERPTTEYSGRVVDAITGNPIAGLAVSVGGQDTNTDGEGAFTVNDLPEGSVLVWIGPSSSTPLAPNGNVYASVEFATTLIPNVLNQAVSDIKLVSITAASTVTSGQTTNISDQISGVSLEVPADGFEVIGTSSRYWRIFVNDAGDSNISFRNTAIGELEFRSEIGIAQSVSGGTVLESSRFFSFLGGENAFDGDLSTTWSSNLGSDGVESAGWIGYDLGNGNERFVREVSITSSSNFERLRDTPLDFDVQVSDDGIEWSTFKNFITPRWSRSENRNFDLGVPFNGELSISRLTPAQARKLPDNIIPCELFTIGPKNIQSAKPITLRVTNHDNLPSGAAVDVWVYNGENFKVAGTGIVSSDAQEIVATMEMITGGDIFALAPRTGAIQLSSDLPGRTYVPGLLNEGNFSTSLSLPGYSSNGQNRALSFVYNSTAAAPSPIISANYKASSLIPNELSAQVEIGGVRYGVPTTASTGEGEGALTEGQIARQAVQLDAGNLAVGRNTFKFISTSKFACSTVSTETTGEIFVDNQIDSPFGRGWTMAELSRLYPQEDGSVLIREGTGQIKDFVAQTDFSTLQDPVRLPLLGPANGELFDLDNDGDNDIVWTAPERGGIVIYENMGDDQFEEKPLLEIGNVSDVPDTGSFPSDVTSIAVGDVDNDGIVDIVAGTQTSDDIFIFFGDISGLDSFLKVRVDDTDSRAVAIGDMDGDGIHDIISFGGELGTNSYFYKGGPTRSFIRQRLNGSTDAQGVLGVTLADFNGDGIDDAFARLRGGFYVFRGVADSVPTFTTLRFASLPNFLGNFSAITDFNKDGRPDYIVSTRAGGVALYQQNSNGSFSGVRTLTVPDADIGELDLADINRDGIDDILSTSGSKIVTWFGLEEGDYGEPEVVETGIAFGSPLLGDLNGDDSFDVIGDTSPTDELLLYFSDPTRSNRYIDPLTDYTELTRNDDGSYTRRYNDGTVLDYNAAGLQTSITDANGNVTAYEYDSEDRVTSITDPVGLVTTFTYGANGKLSRITYPDGRTTQWDYNAAGDLVRYEDVNGDVTTHDYDNTGRIKAITDARGNVTEHSYGPYGRYQGATLSDGTEVRLQIAKTLGLPDVGGETGEFVPADQRETTVTDGRGNVTTTEVNSLGSPIKVTDPLGRVTLYERDINNNVTAMIAPSSVTASGTIRSEFDYDARGNVIAKREAVGTALEREMLYEYEPVFNKVVSMTDYDGFETTYTYDGFSNILTETDPRGGVQSFSYDSAGLPLTSADKNNNQTTMFYNLEGRLERMTDPSGTVSIYEYDGAGNKIRYVEDLGGPLERETLMTYDEKNRMITETAADEGITTYAYDGNDNVTSVTDPTGIVETRSYDVRDRLETINDPATGATIMAYDEDSNITRMTDALGETTEFEYDAVDRLLSSVDAKGQLRAFAYDVRDNITAITDARANISLVTYDELDRPRSRSNPKGETWQFAYDLRDNRTAATKPDGTLITSVYDELSRLTSLSGGDVARDYSYDAQSNLLAANDNLNGISGPQLGFTYDGENRVETAFVSNLFGAGALNNTFTYSYDALDRRASLADSFSGNTTYAYDAVDRLTQVTTPQADVYTTNYDLAGRTLGRVAGNATEMIRQYEAATGRLSSQAQQAGGATFNGFDYSYTERGNIAAITESGEVTRDRAYSYDELERLTEVSVPSAPSQDESYELDPEGNRLSSHLSDMHSTDQANRLESDDSYTYVYDLNGNLISKLAKAGTGLSNWTYSYDTLDQLIEVSQDGLTVESYRYDAFGRRSLISTVEGAGLTTDVALINDGSDRAIDVTQGPLGQAIPLRRYTHSANVDEPLQLETFDTDGTFDAAYTYHADHLGSIRYLTDSSGTIVNAYDYDSYGRPLFGTTSFDQPFAYTGREWDAATGLYHYRARAYDAETGRFLQEDPIGFAAGDLNVYRYVGSNPLSYTDPSGLVAALSTATLNEQVPVVSAGASAIGGGIECLYLGLAEVVELAELGLSDFEADLKNCGANAIRSAALNAITGAGVGAILRGVKGIPKTCAIRCFAAGTLVHTKNGLIPIEQVKIGDKVKSMNPETGEISYKAVTNTHVNQFDAVGLVSIVDEFGVFEIELAVTSTHPFYVVDKGWIHASLLKAGDKLLSDDAKILTVSSATFGSSTKATLTYNFEVADFHTYFVGETGVLVHNGHGNCLNSKKPTALYALVDNLGNHLKFGITNNLNRRYTKKWLADNQFYLVPLKLGSRREIRALEKALNTALRGPRVTRP